MKNEGKGVRAGLLVEDDMGIGCRSDGLCCFLIGGILFASMYEGNMDMEAERGEIKMKKEMKIEINCPVCDAFIEIEDDAGYCIICDEVIYKEPDGTFTSDSLEWLNENPTPKKKKKCRK